MKNLNVPNLSFKREQSETCFDSAERVINQKQNVPNLRFPEFIEDWDQKSISDVANVVGGGTPDTTIAEYWDGNIQWFTPSEIGKSKYISKSERKITQSGLNNSSAKILPQGTILLSTRATIGECSIAMEECSTNQGFQSLISKSNYNSEFVYYLIQTKKKDLIRNACGSTFLEISANEVRKIKCRVPQINEQDKITQLLSLIDKRIATQNKIIEDLKKLKVAIIENAFCGKHYNYKIGDIITQISNRNKSNKETNVLSVSNKLGFVEQSEQFEDRTVASEDVTNYKIVRTNDFAYNPARINVGSIARLKQYESGIVSPMYICFHAKKNVLPEYLEMFFLTQYFKHEMYKRLEGSVRLCLSFEGLTNIPISIPEIPLQKEISKKILAFETKIGIEEHYLNALEKQKQYLLQQMFI